MTLSSFTLYTIVVDDLVKKKGQGISSHGIYLNIQKYSSFSTHKG